jgi:hypothetical protein
MPTLVGIFEQPICVADTAKRLQGRGFTDLEIYSPVPSHEIDRALDETPSRVRIFTLVGGLTGVVTGYAMTIWMANNWQIMLGGKPFSSIPPYTVIAFELTILFGGVLTALGLFLVGRLPSFKTNPVYKQYARRFSSEDFGLIVKCRDRDVSEIDALLRDGHAKEVHVVQA